MVQLVILVVLLMAGTFLFRSYLEHRLKADLQRREQEKTKTATENDVSDFIIIAREPSPSEDRVSLLDSYTEEVMAIDRDSREFLKKTGLSQRDKWDHIARLWDQEMNSLSERVEQHLTEKEKKEFLEEQLRFLKMREKESGKQLSDRKSGAMENVDYLSSYVDLTRQRCFDILKDLPGLGEEAP